MSNDSNSRVILVKTGESSPSVPTSSGRGQPNNFPIGNTGGRRTLHVPHGNLYRRPPKVFDQGLVRQLTPLVQVMKVELLNLMIILQSQKKNNHKNQKLLIMIFDFPSNGPKKKKQSALSLLEN